MPESKEPTTNELYSMQRGQDGKFVSGQRIRDVELPVGFFQINNVLILNYFDHSDRYMQALMDAKKEDLSVLLMKCLRGFNRAMDNEKYQGSESLIENAIEWLLRSNYEIDCASIVFNESPYASQLKNLQSVVDMRSQIIIIALLTSYKLDSKCFHKESGIFEHIDSLLSMTKEILRGYLLGSGDLVNRRGKPIDNCHVIFSRLSALIKNSDINEDKLTLISDALNLSTFSILKDIIGGLKLVSNRDFHDGYCSHVMVSTSSICLPESFGSHVSSVFSFDDSNEPHAILSKLLTMYRKVQSIHDMKEYLLSTISSNDERVETNEIVNTLLLGINITE